MGDQSLRWLVPRSPNNQRDEDITREDYAESLNGDGFVQVCRSDPFVKAPPPAALVDPDDRLALGAATCFEGVVLGWSLYPGSRMLQVTINIGYEAYEIIFAAPVAITVATAATSSSTTSSSSIT